MSFILHHQIRENIATYLSEKTSLDKELIYKNLSPPPNKEMGDLAFGCFLLAKQMKKSPAQIANELASKLQEQDFVQSFQAAGPYLNMKLKIDEIGKTVLNEIITGAFFSKGLTENTPKSMIEYSQPNTHKELHVGHMRNLCLGDALVRFLKYTGHEVISSTFPGDVGTHVAKCLWYMKKHNKEEVPSENKGAWLGAMYTKGNNLLEEQKGSEKEEENRKELTTILQELHQGSGPYYQLWQETRQWSLDLMNKIYQWAEVKFDKWYWESEVDASSVELIKKYYEKGLFVKDQGAIGIDLSEEKLGFCLLLKSDGTGLYATKDIELARRKFEDYQIQKNIYVVDKRQAHHFKQVFKTLEKMGFQQAKDCYHLQYDFVELPDGAMSSRKGNIVPLEDLILQMTSEIKEQYLNKYQGDWAQEEIETTAHIVAAGAIKFGMNRIDPSRKIVFDMKEWLKIDGESGPYIQYVHARIHSLIQKINPQIGQEKINWSVLEKKQEAQLILKLMDFHIELQVATESYRTSHLCSYLYDLSKLFNSFYAECSVANAESEEIKQARLALSYCVAKVLEKGLALLGIRAPLKM